MEYGINEDIVVYDGRFCVYLDKKYKCNGKIFLKPSSPSAITFKARIVSTADDSLEECSLDDAVLEIHGYKLSSATIRRINETSVEGYINNDCIKSKNSYVSYVDFDLLNIDKIPGKLIKTKEKVFAGRLSKLMDI